MTVKANVINGVGAILAHDTKSGPKKVAAGGLGSGGGLGFLANLTLAARCVCLCFGFRQVILRKRVTIFCKRWYRCEHMIRFKCATRVGLLHLGGGSS